MCSQQLAALLHLLFTSNSLLTPYSNPPVQLLTPSPGQSPGPLPGLGGEFRLGVGTVQSSSPMASWQVGQGPLIFRGKNWPRARIVRIRSIRCTWCLRIKMHSLELDDSRRNGLFLICMGAKGQTKYNLRIQIWEFEKQRGQKQGRRTKVLAVWKHFPENSCPVWSS